MKKYAMAVDEYTSTVFVGNPSEIKCLYKALSRDYARGGWAFTPAFTDFPSFNSDKLYGLEICDADGEFLVVNEHVIAGWLYSGNMKLVSDCGDCSPSIPVKGRVTIDED